MEARTPRQLITALEPGKTFVLLDPKRPEKVIAQVSRVGEVYYLLGPLLYDYIPELALQSLFDVGLANNDPEANVAQLLNNVLTDSGVPAEACIFPCQGIQDTLDTLAGLFGAYALPVS